MGIQRNLLADWQVRFYRQQPAIRQFSCWSYGDKRGIKAPGNPEVETKLPTLPLAIGPVQRDLQMRLIQVFYQQEPCWQQVSPSWPCRIEALVVQFREG